MMKRTSISLVVLTSLVLCLVGSTAVPVAQGPGPDAPQAAEQGSGMPGWPVPQRAIPYHKPGWPSRAASYTTQVTQVDAAGVASTVQLTGLDAMTADGIDPLAGNYRLVESAQIVAGSGTYAADMDTLQPALIGGALLPGDLPGDVAAGDLNGDGIDEQIAAWLDTSGHIVLKVGAMPGTGRFTSAPAAAAHADGTIYLLARGLDGSLYHSRFVDSAWSAWDNAAGGLLLSGPAVTSRGAGQLDAFALGVDDPDDLRYARVYHARWEESVGWQSWEVIPTTNPWPALEGVTPHLDLPAPAAVARGDQLDLFRLGPGHTLVHLSFDGTAWDSQWESLGGALRSAPAAVALGSDRMQVFAAGVDGAVWHRTYSGGSWGRWGRLQMPAGISAASAPTAVSLGSNRIQVYVHGSNGELWTNQYAAGNWQGWVSEALPFAPTPASALGAAYRDGQIDLFALAEDGTLQWQTAGTWSALARPACVGQWAGTGRYNRDYGIKVEAGHFQGAGRELIAVSAVRDNDKQLLVALYDVQDGFRPRLRGHNWYDVGFAASHGTWETHDRKYDIAIGDTSSFGADQVVVGTIYYDGLIRTWAFKVQKFGCTKQTGQGGITFDCGTLQGPQDEPGWWTLTDGGRSEHIHLAVGDIDGDGEDGWAVVVGDIPYFPFPWLELYRSTIIVCDAGRVLYQGSHEHPGPWPADVAMGNWIGEGQGVKSRDEIAFVGGVEEVLTPRLSVWMWVDPGWWYKTWPIDQFTFGTHLDSGDLNRDLQEELVLVQFGSLLSVFHGTAPLTWELKSTPLPDWGPGGPAIGDFRGDSLRVGPPTYRVQEQMTSPIMFLNLPPVHRDIVKNEAGENVPLEVLNDAYAEYATVNAQEERSSTTSKRDWELSTGFEMGVGGGGSTVTASLDNTYGENFERSESTIQGIELDDTITADTYDQVVYNATTYGVWEYPVLGIPEKSKTGPTTISVVYPLRLKQDQDQNPLTEPPVNKEYPKSCDENFYAPTHQPYNVWSYDPKGEPWFADYAGEFLVHEATTGGRTTKLTIREAQEEERTASYHNQISAGLEYSYENELSIPLVGKAFDFSFRAYANGSYGWEKISTFGTTLAHETAVTLGFPSTQNPSAYSIDAYLYQAKGGYWVLDYQAQPEPEAGYWKYYDKPDPAFTLNWYGWPLENDPTLRYPCGRDKQLFSHDVLVEPQYVEAGDSVTISATVRNFSPVALGGPLTVRFYQGDPAQNQVIGVDSIAGLARETGPQTASIRWTAAGAGKIKIYAVIDPGDDIVEVHDQDDLIDNNTAYGLLYVAGADYLDPGLRNEVPYQEIKATLGPGLEVTAYLPTTNLTETLRYELVPTSIEGINASGGLFRLDAYKGGQANPPPSHTFAPVPAVLGVHATDQDTASLNLYRLTGTGWEEATCPGYSIDRFAGADRMYVPICKLAFFQGTLVGTFALSDERPETPGSSVYLPMVLRNAP